MREKLSRPLYKILRDLLEVVQLRSINGERKENITFFLLVIK